MVECESYLDRICKTRFQVLIDTWWNVNYIQHSKILNPNKVLIDTWWNVNVRDEIQFDSQNRVLIDTWWNVNFSPVSSVCLSLKF